MSEKRNRESEEDLNERMAKTLALTDVVQKAETNYVSLSKDEQKDFLSDLPEEIQALIASMTVGVLMNLGRVSKMFADLARQDWLWRRCFKRDYPKEYVFCKGELPFYLVAQTHPFWYDGFVKPEDEPSWKRFYLHVANEYRKYVGNFVNVLSDIERDHRLGVDVRYATSREIYNFCHRTILGNQLHWFDWRCKFAWYAVCTIVWYLLYPSRYLNSDRLVCWSFWHIARVIPEYQWLLPYITHSGLNTPQNRGYNDAGPSPDTIFMLFESSNFEGAHLVAENFRDYVEENPPWIQPTLFSTQDRINLIRLVETQRKNPDFRRQRNLETDDLFERQSKEFVTIWDMLSYGFHNPCLFSLGQHVPQSYMIYQSKELQTIIEERRLMAETNRELSVRYLGFARQELEYLCKPLLTVRDTTYVSIFRGKGHGRLTSLFVKYKKLPRTIMGAIKYIQSACISCGTIPKEPKMCGGMCNNKSIVFCGTKCQTIHWKQGHYKECGKK